VAVIAVGLVVVVAGALGIAVAWIALSAPAGLPPYESTCVIASRYEYEAVTASGEIVSRRMPAVDVVWTRMLTYDNVMEALADTDLMATVERESEDDAELRSRLKEELYYRVRQNTEVKPLGATLVAATYRDDTAQHAFIVLRKLVDQMVVSSNKRDVVSARRTRQIARMELERARNELERIETKLIAFRQDHPRVDVRDPAAEMGPVAKELEKVDGELTRMRRQLDRLTAELENETDDAKKKTIEARKAALEDDVEVKLGERRALAFKRTRLAEEERVLPNLRKELAALNRDRRVAERRYMNALEKFERAGDLVFARQEGLVSLSVVQPPRLPRYKSPRPGLLERLLD